MVIRGGSIGSVELPGWTGDAGRRCGCISIRTLGAGGTSTRFFGSSRVRKVFSKGA